MLPLLLLKTAEAGVSGVAELGYSASSTNTSNEGINQRYRLSLDQRFFPKLSFAASGTYEHVLHPSELSAIASKPPGPWNVSANLTLADPFWGLGADYTVTSTAAATGAFLSQTPSARFFLRPTGLPSLNLVVSQQRLTGLRGTLLDRSTTSAVLSTQWTPVKNLDVGYNAGFNAPDDKLSGLATREFTQGARVGWSRRVFADRTTVGASLNLTHRTSQVVSASPGALGETLQSPIQGAAATEELPSTTTDIALTPNTGLWDGSPTSSSGLNVGYSRSVAGDLRYRHFGLEFADPLTKVNRIDVYVDRNLPPGIAGNFTWSAYQSDDGRLWNVVPISGLVRFDDVTNRFEVPLTGIETRHVKVVTAPLAAGVTVEQQYSDIFVTELRAVNVEPVVATDAAQSHADAAATVSARTRITKDLSHDVAILGSSAIGTGVSLQNKWSVSNGLSWMLPVSSWLRAAARVARQDSDYGRGPEGAFTYGASLTATPLPTLNHALVYGGQATLESLGWVITNSVSLLNNLRPYQGVGLMVSGGYSFSDGPTGRIFGETLMGSGTVQPHPRLSLTLTAAHTGSTRTVRGVQLLRTRQNRLEGNASFSPFNNLYVAGGASWTVAEREPVILANSSIGFSPFQGGALQLGVTYSQVLDQSGEVAHFLSPNLRWNIRPGLHLNAGYTLYSLRRALLPTTTHTFSSNLQLVL